MYMWSHLQNFVQFVLFLAPETCSAQEAENFAGLGSLEQGKPLFIYLIQVI